MREALRILVYLKRIRLFWMCCGVSCLLAANSAVVLGAGMAQRDQATSLQDDRDVPYGVAATWLLGHRLLADGDPASALPYLHQAYRFHPEVPTVALDFQQALLAEGYLNDALKVLDQMVTTWPDSLDYRLRRSGVCIQGGQTDRALEDLRYVREHGLNNLDVIAAEGSLLAAEGKTDQALDVYRDGLHLFPEQGEDIYMGMVGILEDVGDTDAIRLLMQDSVEAYPNSPILRVILIRALADGQFDDEAYDAARQADRHFGLVANSESVADTADADADATLGMIDSEIPETPSGPGPLPESFLVELADFYSLRGHFDKAVGILEPLFNKGELELGPSLWLARLYLGQGRQEQGRALVAEILTRWPDAGRAWFLKGRISEMDQNWTDANEAFHQAVDFSAADPEIRIALIRTLLMVRDTYPNMEEGRVARADLLEELRGHVTVARNLLPQHDTQGHLVLGFAQKELEDCENAIISFSVAGRDPSLRLGALIQRSICQDELDLIDDARQTLETLHQEYPDDPEVANSLGYFLAEKNLDLDLAEDLVRNALEADPGNGAYLDSMGWILFRQGRWNDALDQLIRAVNVIPEDPVILEHLGRTLGQLGQYQEALGTLQRAIDLGGDARRLEQLMVEIREALSADDE